jgi:hypothetical protein
MSRSEFRTLVFFTSQKNFFRFRLLDRSFGYPPDSVVEKFQQRLKEIKKLDRYSDFLRAIQLDNVIKSPEDMTRMIQSSIRISNQQGYTRISENTDPPRRYEQRRN